MSEETVKAGAAGAAGTIPGSAAVSASPLPAEPAPPAPDTDFFELLEKAPAAIREYLLSPSTDARFEKVATDFQLASDEIFAMVSVINAIFFRTRPFKEFHGLLAERLKWSDRERLDKLAVEIAGQLFLPASGYIGDVDGFIRDLKVDPAVFPQEKLALQLMSYDAGARQISAEAAKFLPPQFDSVRLQHLIETRLRAVRTDTQIKEQLMKPVKTGGLDLASEDAERILDAIHDELNATVFIEDIVPPVSAAAAAEPRFTPKMIRDIYAGAPEEQADLARHIQNIFDTAGRKPEDLAGWLFIQLFPEEGKAVDRLEVVSAIMALAQTGTLWDVLAKDKRLRNLVADRLAAGNADGAAMLEIDPYQTRFFNFFMQMLLRGFAGLTENDSARFGLRAYNLLKKNNLLTADAELAAFDADEGIFKWLEPVEV
ncbi:MAG: hypothetical protein WCT10_04155 [Patescibacteria group bacterium]|jgi:hypothetical protein